MGRYIDKNTSGYECSMVLHKLYSEISPTEKLKEGVAVGDYQSMKVCDVLAGESEYRAYR